jgi:GDP-4-dehydro-6-deoxy-D-mannose reductase
MGHYYQGRGFDCIVARPFNHIGPGQNPGFIVPDLTKQVIDIEKGLAQNILVGNLDAKRDYTDVRDITRAYRLLLEKGVSGRTYNICSGRSISGHDILDEILRAAGNRPPVEQDATKMRPSDTPDIYGSHDKITADTGWQPQIDIATTIKDVVADWRQRQPAR